MTNRARSLLVILIGVVLCAVSSCQLPTTAAETPTPLRTLRLGVTSVTGTPAGGLGWGDRTGILTRELNAAGVERVEFSFFQSGRDVVAALLSGAIDVAAVGDNPALSVKGNGAEIRLLALDSVNGDTWLIGAKDGPTTIEGLAGRSVTAPLGTIRDRAARQLIDTAGLTGRIEVRDVPTPESIAGLASGRVDATMVGGTGAVQLARQGFPVLDRTSDHDGLASVGTTIATQQFVDEHPEVVTAWQRAVVAVNTDIRDRLAEYTDWVAETDGVDVELVRESVSADEFNTEPFPADGLAQLANAYAFLTDDGTIATAFDLDDWVVAP